MIAILSKELRGRMRGWGSPLLLTGFIALQALVAILVFAAASGDDLRQTGPDMAARALEVFVVLSVMQTVLILMVAPALTAGTIAGERERQTLDLLLSTRLTALEIVAGKLVAGLAFTLLLILASLPLLGIVFLFGGVSIGLLLRTAAVQITTALMLGAAGVMFSSLVRRPGAATVLGLLSSLFLTVFTIPIGLWTPPIGVPSLPDSVYRNDLSTWQQGEIYVRHGDAGFSWRVRVTADHEHKFVLPLAFYVNPAIGLVSALDVPGAPHGAVTEVAHLTNEGAGRVRPWLSYCLASGGVAALALLVARRRVDPWGRRPAVQRVARKQSVPAATLGR